MSTLDAYVAIILEALIFNRERGAIGGDSAGFDVVDLVVALIDDLVENMPRKDQQRLAVEIDFEGGRLDWAIFDELLDEALARWNALA